MISWPMASLGFMIKLFILLFNVSNGNDLSACGFKSLFIDSSQIPHWWMPYAMDHSLSWIHDLGHMVIYGNLFCGLVVHTQVCNIGVNNPFLFPYYLLWFVQSVNVLSVIVCFSRMNSNEKELAEMKRHPSAVAYVGWLKENEFWCVFAS